ncbi:hypothetical protein NKV53_03865 [Legionella sp. 27cVA30]|uniref:Uncharacterized protein n=1 Tax=Legionella septentrionalis TaxID=2498109 RepID=A0A433JKV1_9GAMM|nr:MULTISPECIES: hypothetical protein [Legionella]MCP0913503.1 hypothetical protein [Legionella sp. 27cVA30]RUQ89722.1 hypothetical protein EKM59_02895 [Legionella septentrionalis]
MEKQVALLDKLSGFFFLSGLLISKLGFMTSRFKTAPFVILSLVLNLISLTAYLIGYIAWFLAALFYPDHPKKQDSWYGFAQFKEQYQGAAFLGAVATVICMAFPTILILASWLYTASNVMWLITEYHKYQNPVHEKNSSYSSEKQATYLRYAVLTTCSSVITTLIATIGFLFPQITFLTLLISVFLGNLLTLPALYFWGQYSFLDFKPDEGINQSYTTLCENLLLKEVQHTARLPVISEEEITCPLNLTPESSHAEVLDEEASLISPRTCL